MKGALPPSHVNNPVAIAYAEADDALIVTMPRILGLWTYDYERTPALTPEQLAEFTGRPRSTLYRQLKQLREMQWIRVDQTGRRIIIRPLIARNGKLVGKEADSITEPTGEPARKEALLQALAEIGVENPKRRQLARLEIDPLWVRQVVSKERVAGCPTSWKESLNGKNSELTTWFRVMAWRKLAEAANEYLDKGQQVFVETKPSRCLPFS